MRFDVITLFPETIDCYCSASILGKALDNNYIEIYTHNLREYGQGKHRQVDDIPYGGGTGMILKPEPIFEAWDNIPKFNSYKTLALTPRGEMLTQPLIRNTLTQTEQLIIICGRYEGIDERVMSLVDHQICLGNYILTGGEIGAMTIIDSVSRLVEGVLPKGVDVHGQDSFSDDDGEYIEAPQYTRPRKFRDLPVPEVLLNGNHKEIEKWRKEN